MNKSPFSNENNHFSLGRGYFFDTKNLILFYINNPPSLSSLRTLVYRLKSKIEFDMIDSSYQHGYRLVIR